MNLLSPAGFAEDVANSGQWLLLELKEADKGPLYQVTVPQVPKDLEI